MNDKLTVPTPVNSRFYVVLSPRGRMVGWGQFDPKHPRLEEEVLVSDFAKWAGKQSLGHQRLENGNDFWVGSAPELQAAVRECVTAAEAFDAAAKAKENR